MKLWGEVSEEVLLWEDGVGVEIGTELVLK